MGHRQIDSFQPVELANVVWAAASLGYRMDGNCIHAAINAAQVCSFLDS